MFKAAGFKIRFERQRMNIFISSLKDVVERDIVICNIYEEMEEGWKEINSGAAILNPTDVYDKVVGKKIALTEALSCKNGNKVELGKNIRTKIWKAFWEWVESWAVQSFSDSILNATKAMKEDIENDETN